MELTTSKSATRLASCAGIAVTLLLGGCGGGGPTAPTGPPAFEPKDFVEALFLGTGPLADPASRGCRGVLMDGWAPGSVIRVRISTTLSAVEREGAMGPLAQLPDATDGMVSATVEFTDERLPFPRAGEITVTSVVDPVAVGCPPNSSLCTIFTSVGPGGSIGSARIVGRVGNLGGGYSHEMGHAALGFCHINPKSDIFNNQPGRSPSTVMGFGSGAKALSDQDFDATRSAYDAGLHVGASRREFLAAQLINP